MSYSFHGVALVVGAASGIGRAVVLSLAESGCSRIVIADVSGEGLSHLKNSLSEKHGSRLEILSVICDVRKESDVDDLFARASEKFGALHYCVNSAGIVSPAISTADCSLEEFKATIEVNQRGTWLLLRAQVKQMIAQSRSLNGADGPRGSIVNVAATQGIATQPGLPSYAAANYGIVGMTRTTAMDYISSGIRINCICPGPTETTGLVKSGSRDVYERTVPLRRVNKPDEVASAVLFLLSGLASAINGVALPVDSGWSLCHY